MFLQFLRSKSAAVETLAPSTPEDLLAEAHAAWKAAEVVLTDACTALNHFRLTHPQHVPVKKIGDDTWVQFTPNDPELLKLSSAENRARFDRDAKLKAWSDLKLKFSATEAVHVAGQLVTS